MKHPAEKSTEQHALVIFDGVPAIWHNHNPSWEGFLAKFNGRLIQVYPSREEAEKALAALKSDLSGQ
jgi:hypothetical protein